jgi:hypothetical protein
MLILPEQFRMLCVNWVARVKERNEENPGKSFLGLSALQARKNHLKLTAKTTALLPVISTLPLLHFLLITHR